MRRLILLCKRSLTCNTFLLMFSCYSVMHLPPASSPVLPRTFWPRVQLLDGDGTVFAGIEALSCSPRASGELQVRIGSASHTFTITFKRARHSGWQVTDGDRVITRFDGMAELFFARLCRQVVRKRGVFVAQLRTEQLIELERWLSVVSPPCRFSYLTHRGFYCALKHRDLAVIVAGLKRIQRRVVDRWQRQPYLLVRRLNIALQLAQSLTANEPLDTFCRLLQVSYSSELPLVFNDTKWRSGVCAHTVIEEAITVAYNGLELAYQEIQLFTKLFERTSKMGNVAVRISADERPGKRFWLELIPETDVISGVERSYRAILDTHPPSGCWHPLLTGTMSLARAIGLVDSCGNYPSFVANTQIASYFIDSIASEMAFAISNGRVKLLRLPKGNYRYRIAHTPNYYLPSSTTEVAYGNLQWQEHGRPLISSWQPSEVALLMSDK